MNKNKNKLIVKENFDEDDSSDDVDDEVFVRDGKKMIAKVEKHKGDEQPLMSTRNKMKQKQRVSSPEVCSRQPCNIYNCLLPVYFGIATIISIAFLMLLYIFLVDKLPLLVNKFDFWSNYEHNRNNITVPCLNLKLNNIWTQSIPKFTSDAQIEMVDVNKDNVDDIILGIGTELDLTTDNERMCIQYFGKNNAPCSGGVTAIDGKLGNVIWHRWLHRLILSVHCKLEITGDLVPDCIVTGKGGLLAAISGANGSIIWEFPKSVAEYELYNVVILRDMNDDNYLDILASHCSKNGNTQSDLVLISGRDRKEIQKLQIPSHERIFNAPQILTDIDGNEQILFTTGDLYNSGGLYIISVHDFLTSDHSKIKLLTHYETGIITAPIMVDINSDDVQDIVFLASNTVYAFDGGQYNTIWNVSLYQYVPEMYQISTTSSVTPGYFNDDWIPDLLVTFAVGGPFPEYYYTTILVLDGQSGKLLLDKPITRSSVPDTVGAITLGFTGNGNDAFLYWVASCQNYVDAKNRYRFMSQEDRQLSADLCALRFNSTQQLELYGLSQHIEPPGLLLYAAKSHKNSLSDSINFDQENSEEQLDPPLYYKIKTRNRKFHPSLVQHMLPVELENIDKPFPNDWKNAWKTQKSGHRSNTFAKYSANDDVSDQPNDYEIDIDNIANDGNEKIYKPRKIKKDISEHNVKNVNDMLPKVTASGAITKAFDSDDLDLILVHYEIKADRDIRIITDKNEECIRERLSSLSILNSKYYGTSQDKIMKDCYEKNYIGKESKQEKPTNYELGNLFITRNRISCSCDVLRDENKEICSSILPYQQQSYPIFLGKLENSAYNTRKNI